MGRVMVKPVEASPHPETQHDDSLSGLQSPPAVRLENELPVDTRDHYKYFDVWSEPGKPVSWRIFWYIVPHVLNFLFRTLDFASSVRQRLAGESGEHRMHVDAAHPTCVGHRFTPAGGIEAEYWIFIPVKSADRLELAAKLVLKHLRNWRTFYRRSHVEFLGHEPDPSVNDPVLFKFAPLAPWGKKYTGREFTNLTVSFDAREPLPEGNGWIVKGRLIDGYDDRGERLPHDFVGPVQTEVRMINEPGRVGIEVRDIWVDVMNHKPVPDFAATRMHLFRSMDGFGGLRKVVLRELKNL